jgi:hypothetical protein
LATNRLKSRLVEENRQRAWQLWCQGLPQHAIAKEVGVSQASVEKYIATVRNRHPAQALAGDETGRFVEGYELMREAGLLMRQELARMKAHGEDVRPLLGTLSIHADRHSRFLTRQQAAPVVEVNAGSCFDNSLWAGLLGANHQAAMADAAVVETLDCAQIEPVQASESQPEMRVPASQTVTQAMAPEAES